MTEFSHPIPVADIGRNVRHHRIAMTVAEAAHVAKRLGVDEVRSLSAALTVAKRRGAVIVAGTFAAEIVQVCVVSLEPFVNPLAGEIDEIYKEPDDKAPAGEVAIDMDTPEPLEGDTLDLGELVVQYLALEIDSHPRAPNADLNDLEAPTVDGVDPTHPFAGLAKLQQKP
jgi:uncharacterized metal-binding protein YceD (DUF177 family)